MSRGFEDLLVALAEEEAKLVEMRLKESSYDYTSCSTSEYAIDYLKDAYIRGFRRAQDMASRGWKGDPNGNK